MFDEENLISQAIFLSFCLSVHKTYVQPRLWGFFCPNLCVFSLILVFFSKFSYYFFAKFSHYFFRKIFTFFREIFAFSISQKFRSIFSRNFRIIFFAKFLPFFVKFSHFLFRKNFAFFRDWTDWSKILWKKRKFSHFLRVNKMRKQSEKWEILAKQFSFLLEILFRTEEKTSIKNKV